MVNIANVWYFGASWLHGGRAVLESHLHYVQIYEGGRGAHILNGKIVITLPQSVRLSDFAEIWNVHALWHREGQRIEGSMIRNAEI